MNCIISTFFSSKKGPQNPNTWNGEDFEIIRAFYESVIRNDMNCIILIDSSSEEFIQTYQTEKIRFVRCSTNKLNLVDIRWRLYQNLLIEREDIENAFFVDISDVVVLRDPFKHIQSGILYCGDEQKIYCTEPWMTSRLDMLNQDLLFSNYYQYQNKLILNAGILGGPSKILKDVCKRIADILETSNIEETTVDMCAFNHVLRIDYSDILVHGNPVNTVFRQFDYSNKEAWLCHK
jgi:hypothetical protein